MFGYEKIGDIFLGLFLVFEWLRWYLKVWVIFREKEWVRGLENSLWFGWMYIVLEDMCLVLLGSKRVYGYFLVEC